MSLLKVRKRLHSLEESTRQLAPVTDQPLSKIDEQVDVQDGGGVTHTQLCSDAVSFLQSGSETIVSVHKTGQGRHHHFYTA